MDLLSKRIIDQVREKAQVRSAEQAVKGVMSKNTEQAEVMDKTMQAMQDVIAKTIEARTPRDEETPSLDYYQEQDVDSTEDATEAQAKRIQESATTTFKAPDDAGLMSKPDADGVQPMGGKDFEFEPTSKRLVEDLKKDFDLTTMQASAIVGNLATETDNFNTLQEYKPVVEGSRGGYGFAQWTGQRRKRYEAWAKENNLDPSTYEANYGYLKYELSNTDPEIGNMGKNTIKRLKKATNLNEATSIVMKGYLKPGVPHLNKRQKSAAAILGFFD